MYIIHLYHKFCRWLEELLESFRDLLSNYCFKDYFELVELLGRSRLDAELVHSIDVDSLFTNMPLYETVDDSCRLLHSLNLSIGLSLEYLSDLILLCTHNVLFEFEGTAYKQIECVTAGSPLCPVLAAIFLGLIERKIAAKLSEAKLYKLYVDDILIFTSGEHIE